MLKARLDKKDVVIAERDARIHKLLNEVMKLKDRIHQLELRLTTDESQWCSTCKYKEEEDRKFEIVNTREYNPDE
jgi:hypothetical protein